MLSCGHHCYLDIDKGKIIDNSQVIDNSRAIDSSRIIDNSQLIIRNSKNYNNTKWKQAQLSSDKLLSDLAWI